MLNPGIVIVLVCIYSLFPVCASEKISTFYTQESGAPFVTNYSPSKYNAHGQNWAIIEDNDGYMYFGNTDGCVLQYDGVQWRQIPVTNSSIVRSLGRDSNGTIYVGAQNEIGFLAPDSCGSLVFQSILVDIPEEFREFGDVWQIHFIQNLLYFSTRKYLFRRNNDGTYKIWQAKNVLGQKVITLVNEFQQSGKYQVQWNASGFPSGVYYYQLETGNYRDVKKMFLLR